ncbi:MAG: threonylcarbamoyl-AMP synthase [Candidatus Aenigmarchaeota archaeon]|nr:threonylcarbamoyl-AMP synthase [Candidatus Aenigmarchaeota archaeon]
MVEKKLNDISISDIKTKIIVYPTDTVYGIGCNAEDASLVNRVYIIKKRKRDVPVSVIAPSKKWILDNFVCEKEDIDKYLPGAYTLVVRKKDSQFLNAVSLGDSVGIRMILHEFQDAVSAANIPFITTSANISGKETPKSFSDIDVELKNNSDIVVDEGTLKGKPSKIIDVTGLFKEVLRD